MNRRSPKRSRAVAALLLFVILTSFASACANQPAARSEEQKSNKAVATAESDERASEAVKPDEAGEKTVRAVLPEDVLSEEEIARPPERKDWLAEGSAQPKQLVSSNSSTGAIPAVKPFNFGRDPGGPEDKTMYLSVPKIGLKDVEVFDSLSEDKIRESTVHVPATGFPWQEGANTYIAGHRLGYPNTGSYYVFFNVPDLVEGDEIVLRDAAGATYTYRVFKKVVVGPKDVEVMNPVEGKSIVTLQTCTLPNYSRRVIVQGELVDETPA